jgi:hypothetical protein
VRFALTGTHAMFYAGATPSIAMWETLFRDVPGGSREVLIRRDELEGRYCVEIELTRDVPHLALAQAPMRTMMTFEGPAWREVEALCRAETYGAPTSRCANWKPNSLRPGIRCRC